MTSRRSQTAARLQRFGTTIFSDMSALALAEGAVNLGQGFPDFDPPTALTAAATRAITTGLNQYAPGIGVPILRQAVAQHAQTHHGLVYDPDTEVTVTTGATEAVFAAIHGLLEPGDEVIVLEPAYDSYPAAIAMAGGVVRPVALRPQTAGGWRLEERDLQAALSPLTRAIVINSPHNPLGKVFDDEELTSIVAGAAQVDAVIIADEVYEHLTFNRPHHSVCHIPGGRDRTIRISSAAKTFSVTGWKVGWACAPPDLTDALRAAKQWTTFTSGTPFQHAVAVALDWDDHYFDTLTADYRQRRELLCEGLVAAGLSISPPDGTFFIAADIRGCGFTDDLDFCRRLPREVGVGAIPISMFHQDPEAARGFVRFAFCKTDDALREGISRLRAGLPSMARDRTP